MPLESDTSAELGEAEITVLSAESFGSQQAVGPGTDDRETHRDMSDPMQATTHPHPVHTVTLITTFK